MRQEVQVQEVQEPTDWTAADLLPGPVINGYLNQGMQSSVGDGTSEQWLNANVVSEEDAQPGDLVFQSGPEAGSDNHVGIICGQTDAGDWIAVHCSSSKNGVTVGEAYGQASDISVSRIFILQRKNGLRCSVTQLLQQTFQFLKTGTEWNSRRSYFRQRF